MTPKQVTKAVFAPHDAVEHAAIDAVAHEAAEALEPVVDALEPTPPLEETSRKPSSSTAPEGDDPGAEDVRRRMIRAGASAAFAEQVTGYVHRKGLRGAFAIDGAAEVLGKLFHVAGSPRRANGPARVVFFGPTGAGKTACVGKLGRKLAGAGRRVAYASLDPLGFSGLQRVGSLEGDRDRTELPLSPIVDASELAPLLAKQRALDVVLIDTPGVSPGDEAGLADLALQLSALAEDGPIEGYLVLPATLERSAAEFAATAFAALGPTGAVVTKLDETRAPAAALEALQRRRLPIAFLADGQDLRAHLVRPRPADFADLFLRGRTS